ncbi:MAG: nucleoside hydrolase [Bacteroidales bacterium]|nr:nucleoside hydrolase [Bacteroidales bacterium]
MKRIFTIAAIAAAALASVCCRQAKEEEPSGPLSIIFETDMGNDVDDAMALDLLYKYMDEGRINLLGVMLNKVEYGAAEYVDVARVWYGYPDVPIGIIKEGADCSTDAVNYAAAVAGLRNEDGTPLFKRGVEDCSTLPLAVDLYRKILAEQPDGSVTIVSTGFSTNLARLLDSPADEYSELCGKDLVAAKVARLVTMAGCMLNETSPEYNITKDVPSARKVFTEWPTEVITSPFEVGIAINYPGQSIQDDFGWAEHHPMVEAYKAYLPMPYDRPTWDLTSVLYAVEGVCNGDTPYFNVVGPGSIDFTDTGCTIFTPDPHADRYYLSADSLMCANVLGRFKEKMVLEPAAMASSEQ